MLHDFSSTIFGQSWTKQGDKLWDLYPPNNQRKSIRVQISTDSLKGFEADQEWEKVSAFEINYVEEPNLKEELSLSIQGNQISFGHTLLRKRKLEFEHEQEVCLAVMDWDYALFNKRNVPSMLDKIRTMQRMVASGIISQEVYDENVRNEIRILSKLKTPHLRKASFRNVENFIESVMVHPHAEDAYVCHVGEFCAKYGIKFLGKA